MTILWLQSHGFQRCVPSLCQSSDFCQLPFRNSSFFQNNAGLFILLHFCGRKKGDGATTVCLFSLYPCERAHNYWGPCCQHLFSLWSPSSWIRKMKSGKFLVIAWKNFETFCTKAALNIHWPERKPKWQQPRLKIITASSLNNFSLQRIFCVAPLPKQVRHLQPTVVVRHTWQVLQLPLLKKGTIRQEPPNTQEGGHHSWGQDEDTQVNLSGGKPCWKRLDF